MICAAGIDWALTHRGEEQWTVGGVVEEHPEWAGPTPRLIEELNRRVHGEWRAPHGDGRAVALSIDG